MSIDDSFTELLECKCMCHEKKVTIRYIISEHYFSTRKVTGPCLVSGRSLLNILEFVKYIEEKRSQNRTFYSYHYFYE